MGKNTDAEGVVTGQRRESRMDARGIDAKKAE